MAKNRIIVLIDAENVSYNNIGKSINKLSTLGTVKLKIAYANWKKNNLKNWNETIKKYSIQTVQQFDDTAGKNVTDIKLVVEAMKMLYTNNNTEAFSIMASDSDYTPLIQAIKEHGLLVYGFGENHTPKSFIQSCDNFFYFSELNNNSNEQLTTKYTNISNRDLKLLKKAINFTIEEDNWSHLGAVGRYLNENTLFDISKYKTKLGKLFQNSDDFEVTWEDSVMYVQINNKIQQIDSISKKDLKLLKMAIRKTKESDDWANLSQVGKYLSENTSFDIKKYNTTLGKLIQNLNKFKVDWNDDSSIMYVQI